MAAVPQAAADPVAMRGPILVPIDVHDPGELARETLKNYDLPADVQVVCDVNYTAVQCFIGVCSPHFRHEQPAAGAWGSGPVIGVYVGGVGPSEPGIQGTGFDSGNWYAGYGC